MAWITPIFDRTVADTVTARQNQANENGNKGALNFHDLNRIEGNFRYLEEHLKADGVFIPRNFRNYTETTYQMVEKKKLPDGYTQVEYIESTGTQYIDTGFKPNQNTRIVIDIDVTASSVASSLFGARNSYQNNGFALHTGSSNAGYQIDYATNTNKVTTITSSGRHKIDFNGNILTVDDTVINTYSEAAFQCNYTALIFSVHSGDTLMHENYPTKAKLYSCRIYDNNTLVRDFVPCVNDSGVGCLYDKVNQVCYYKNGTGDFIVGSAKRELPDGFTQVEYIESTGTQYIDTEIEPNQDTKVVIDALYTQDSNASFLFGSDAGSATKSFGFGAANGNLRIAYNNVSTYFANGLSFANKIHVVVDKNVATINNQYSVSGTYATFEPNYSVWLFGNNRQGTLYGGKDGTRIYSCEIYDNDTIVRDFVPCIKGEGTDSVAGLYDLVNGVFYTNAGTGVFSIGNTVQPEIVYEMQETKTTYTDWQEQNLPWLSEINRIRANYNALVRLFLVGMGLPVLAESNFLNWQEVNDWERIADIGKTMLENMEQEYRYCGMENSGGDRLL